MADCSCSACAESTQHVRVNAIEVRRARFMANVVMGNHPKMMLLSKKYASIVGKGDKFGGLFSNLEDLTKALQSVSSRLFTMPTMDAEWHFPSRDSTLDQVVVFLIFVYGVRLRVENNRWFDFWYIIDCIQDYMPGFDVDDADCVMRAECATSPAFEDNGLANAMCATRI